MVEATRFTEKLVDVLVDHGAWGHRAVIHGVVVEETRGAEALHAFVRPVIVEVHALESARAGIAINRAVELLVLSDVLLDRHLS